MEERDDKETRLAGLRLSISMALAAIILALAVVAALAWRRHSDSARLEHRATALQQTDPISVDESHGSLFGGAMPHVPRDLSLYDRKWPPADGDLTFSFISISDQDRRQTRI